MSAGKTWFALCVAMSCSAVVACFRPAAAAHAAAAFVPALRSTGSRALSSGVTLSKPPLVAQATRRTACFAGILGFCSLGGPSRRGLAGGASNPGGGDEERAQSAALRALWKIRGSAVDDDSTALRSTRAFSAEETSDGHEEEGEAAEPSSLLPPSAYDDLPPLPNAIGQQQSRDYANSEDDYTFEGVKRAGTVSIIGAPNAGKSTLLNQLVGSKIAIVTHKRQTTRTSITGIAMEEGTQVVYIDTPGIMAPRPKERLNKAMVKSAWNSARDADEIFFIVDADKIIPGGMGPGRTGRKVEPLVHPVAPEVLRFRKNSNEELIMTRLRERRQRYNLILNKVDQLRDDRKMVLLALAEELRRCAGLLLCVCILCMCVFRACVRVPPCAVLVRVPPSAALSQGVTRL